MLIEVWSNLRQELSNSIRTNDKSKEVYKAKARTTDETSSDPIRNKENEAHVIHRGNQ